jgi:hypothetical protein
MVGLGGGADIAEDGQLYRNWLLDNLRLEEMRQSEDGEERYREMQQHRPYQAEAERFVPPVIPESRHFLSAPSGL